ncbi:DEAD DEAH box helicase [Coemansia sp. RSA 552]|nr:DEAD DEAH box helicase [Coemansia sp. RSA 552]
MATGLLAHREELLVQAARQIQKASPDLHVEIDQGTRKANPAADVVVASVPTLGRKHSGRLTQHDPQRFKCIVIDEAHHAAAETYQRIVAYFQTDQAHRVVVWGCSATLRRHDGLGLTGVFDQIVYQKHFIEMIREGWLTGLRIVTVRTNTNLDSVRSYAGEFSTALLSRTVNNPVRNLAVVQAYQSLAVGRKSVLVFAVDVNHAQTLRKLFVHYGVPAEVVLGITPTAERVRILSEFREGKVPVVINCGILTEGTDIPNIDCVMMARPTRSAGLFQQMLGRGMRLSPGKEDCLVVDFVDLFRRNTKQMTVPTLLGLDPKLVLKDTSILDDDAIRQLQQEQLAGLEKERPVGKEGLEKEPSSAGAKDKAPRPVAPQEDPSMEELPAVLSSLKALGFRAQVHLNPLNFFELDKRPRGMGLSEYARSLDTVSSGGYGLRSFSKLAWVSVSPERHIISGPQASYCVTRNSSDNLWYGSKRGRLGGKARYISLAEKPIGLKADSLASAIRGMDSLIAAQVPRFQLGYLRWDAPWRAMPSTDGQLAHLRKLGLNVPSPEPANKEGPANIRRVVAGEPRQITRGAAANLIVRMTSGASKHWRKTTKRVETPSNKKAAIWATSS